MNIIVFTESYFDGKVSCNSLVECKKVIHKHSNTNVRVQIEDFRLLLQPSSDGVSRNIDGYSDLSLLYRYFNNLTEDGLSHVIVGNDGKPGGLYVSNVKNV
jgi:hypothetical protein